jgi:hypothetical protein
VFFLADTCNEHSPANSDSTKDAAVGLLKECIFCKGTADSNVDRKSNELLVLSCVFKIRLSKFSERLIPVGFRIA